MYLLCWLENKYLAISVEWFSSHLLIVGCDIGVQVHVHLFVHQQFVKLQV